MSKTILIDCGAGGSKLSTPKLMAKYPGMDTYAFECDPRSRQALEDLSFRHNFRFYNRAVWIRDEKIQYYPGRERLLSAGSLIAKKKWVDTDNPVTVQAFDFSTWLHRVARWDDEIICKMDIEGAEYAVLGKMLDDETIGMLDILHVEWHWKKLANVTGEQHTRLLERLRTWAYESGHEKSIQILHWG